MPYSNYKTYKVSILGQKDYHMDRDLTLEFKLGYGQAYKKIVLEVMRHFKLTTPRANPESISCTIKTSFALDGEMVERPCWQGEVTPPLTRMTAAEFNAECDTILADMPPEFTKPITEYAYGCDHSGGFEEVSLRIKELAAVLIVPLRKFENRIKSVG